MTCKFVKRSIFFKVISLQLIKKKKDYYGRKGQLEVKLQYNKIVDAHRVKWIYIFFTRNSELYRMVQLTMQYSILLSIPCEVEYCLTKFRMHSEPVTET